MPLVEGVRGPEAIRYCELCEEYTLQLVGSWYANAEMTKQGIPSEYSHLGPHCPVCEDKIKNGDLSVGDSARDGVDGVRRPATAA